MIRSLTAERAREVLAYDADTGLALWRVPMSNRPAGIVAGTRGHYGYFQVKIDGVIYKLHRVIWLIRTGRWPSCDIDHINGLRSDNRWANLREATRSQNCANVGKRRRKAGSVTSTFKGVFRTADGKWRAQIRLPCGGRKSLGRFTEEAAAARAYDAAAKIHWGSYARPNFKVEVNHA